MSVMNPRRCGYDCLNSGGSHLSDILVADSADLLNVGGALGDGLEGVSGQLELVLDVGGGDDLNTRLASDAANDLLAKEVSV